MPKKLLSDSQIEDIKVALQDVTFTFFVTPVKYHKNKGSIDRWQEDRAKNFDDYDLEGMAEYADDDGDKVKVSPLGRVDEAEVKVSFNFRDLEDQSLIDDQNFPKMTQKKDYMTVKGVLYRVILVCTDGPLDDKPVLVLVYGTKKLEAS